MIHLSFRYRLKPALELQVVALCRAEPELSGAILFFSNGQTVQKLRLDRQVYRLFRGKLARSLLVGLIEFSSNIVNQALPQCRRSSPSPRKCQQRPILLRRNAAASQSCYLRVTVKHAPEHPVAVVSLSRRPARNLHNLLGVIILNWVVAGQLDKVITSNTLTSGYREGLLKAT